MHFAIIGIAGRLRGLDLRSIVRGLAERCQWLAGLNDTGIGNILMVDNLQIEACLIELNYLSERDSIGPDESLFDTGVIDSLAVSSLVSLLTSRFDIVVPVEDLLPDNFDSVSSIARYVNGRLASADSHRI